MKNEASSQKRGFFENLALNVTKFTGSTTAIILAASTIVIWASTGPYFHFSEVWQMVINTGTTIVTFLMVFFIQKAQNKDSLAIQLKLDELLASNKLASNRLVDVEDLTEEELQIIQKHYAKLKKTLESLD